VPSPFPPWVVITGIPEGSAAPVTFTSVKVTQPKI